MPDTAIVLPFAAGDRRFWLPLPAVIELERRSGRDIFSIYDALGRNTATRLEIRETIRLGLDGGSRGHMCPTDLAQMMSSYTHPARPLSDDALVAWCILHAAVSGIDLQKTGGKAGGKAQRLRKGQIIANCGGMHLDWERLSLSGYFEALEAHNEAHQEPNSGGVSDPERLRRFVEAHRRT